MLVMAVFMVATPELETLELSVPLPIAEPSQAALLVLITPHLALASLPIASPVPSRAFITPEPLVQSVIQVL